MFGRRGKKEKNDSKDRVKGDARLKKKRGGVQKPSTDKFKKKEIFF